MIPQSQTIYLDNSSTARPSAEAVSKMLLFHTEKWGIPSQPHQMGQEVAFHLEEAYRSIYRLLGAKDQDAVVFTSSGAEAVNQAIFSTYQEVSLPLGKNHFIATAIDEAPSMMSIHRLESFGCSTTQLKPNQKGIIEPKSLVEAMTPRTALFSLPWASGLTGVVQPIGEIAEICKLRGVRLVVDATHALGKIFFEIKDLPIDFLAFNGEQIHAPKGTGGLYAREGVFLTPFIVGGMEQGGLRAGSLNVPGLVGLGVAAKQAMESRDYICTEVARIRMHFENEVMRRIPSAKILFGYEERVPHITAISFPGVLNEALLFSLNRRGIFASIGGGSQQQMTYFLHTCGAASRLAESALSFSLSRETTEEQVELAAQALEVSYMKLRKVSADLVKGDEGGSC
jgi:cysteine desulfurase